MKKRVFHVLLAILLCIATAIPVSASLGDTTFVIDEPGNITEETLVQINEYAKSISEPFGIDILYVYTNAESITEYVENADLSNSPNYILMIENDDAWKVSLGGTALDYIKTEEDIQKLRDAYNAEDYYHTGVIAYISTAVSMIDPSLGIIPEDGTLEDAMTDDQGTVEEVTEEVTTEEVVTVVDLETQTDGAVTAANEERLVDMADILSDEEEANVLSKLDAVSESQNMDVVVVTVDSLDGQSPMDYADHFYESNQYGYGDDKDGILLLVAMNESKWWMTTSGFGITAITDAGIEYISERFLSDLSAGEYENAFVTFADSCDEFITQARTGEPYDTDNLPKASFNFVLYAVISIAIGFIIAFIITSSMKSKLKTVRRQSAASEYVDKNSMNIVYANEFFLNRNVVETRKPDNDRSGGGSSTHTTDSGSTFGGGGGSF